MTRAKLTSCVGYNISMSLHPKDSKSETTVEKALSINIVLANIISFAGAGSIFGLCRIAPIAEVGGIVPVVYSRTNATIIMSVMTVRGSELASWHDNLYDSKQLIDIGRHLTPSGKLDTLSYLASRRLDVHDNSTSVSPGYSPLIKLTISRGILDHKKIIERSCMAGNLALLKQIFDLKVISKSDIYHIAVSHGRIGILDWLRSIGLRDYPIAEMAAAVNMVSVLRWTKKHNLLGNMAIIFEVAARTRHMPIINWLWIAGYRPTADVIAGIVRQNLDLWICNFAVSKGIPLNRNILYLAAEMDDVEMVKKLIAKFKPSVELLDAAILGYSANVVRYLISVGYSDSCGYPHVGQRMRNIIDVALIRREIALIRQEIESRQAPDVGVRV